MCVPNVPSEPVDKQPKQTSNACDPHMFKHHPLDISRQQIRLLRLLRTSEPDHTHYTNPIRCEIKIFDVDAAPQYVTLSYTWGPPTPLNTVDINGDLFKVRENLFDFLAQYQDHPANTDYLWIDQLCIDQDNIEERNHQVRLMSQIYKGCLRAIVWLDKSSHDAAYEYKASTGMPGGGDPCPILFNPYFSRIWIVQEVLLAPEVRLLCGGIWIDWATLGEAARSLRYTAEPVLQNLQNLWYTETKAHLSWRLQSTIMRFVHNDCQDPRDKVYGLLSLTTDGDVIEVDYNKSVAKVFLDTVNAIFEQTWPASNQPLWYIVWEDLARLPKFCSRLAEGMQLAETLDETLEGDQPSALEQFFEAVLDLQYRGFIGGNEQRPTIHALISYDEAARRFSCDTNGLKITSHRASKSSMQPTSFRIAHDKYFEDLRRSSAPKTVHLDFDIFGPPPSQADLIRIVQAVKQQTSEGYSPPHDTGPTHTSMTLPKYLGYRRI
ncbi:hypothetical protein E8E12_004196 [Didymella heteroderae]|uniref:Heterokaryon incompatibility domain-containing protein n=1 Tax=Didymella heteroderae TaxID=1769908 RepID=A0A9P4WQV4_9PLEO|nr:hypothetical protein E8E12_004196 [Didymella heteroderae]